MVEARRLAESTCGAGPCAHLRTEAEELNIGSTPQLPWHHHQSRRRKQRPRRRQCVQEGLALLRQEKHKQETEKRHKQEEEHMHEMMKQHDMKLGCITVRSREVLLEVGLALRMYQQMAACGMAPMGMPMGQLGRLGWLGRPQGWQREQCFKAGTSCTATATGSRWTTPGRTAPKCATSQ